MTLRLAISAVLALGGCVLTTVNGRKLWSDWPRPKPRHNVDATWIQVYLGLAAVLLAWALVANPAHLLFEPTPSTVTADQMQDQSGGR